MKSIKLMIMSIVFMSVALAETGFAYDINSTRTAVAERYVEDLGSANVNDIVSLFEENGTVVSTSRGRMKAKDFFNAFLPEIAEATTTIHQTLSGKSDPNRVALRFYFAFKLKDGEKGEGEYIDEFMFSNNSTKLTEVIMFENVKYKELDK